MIRDYEPRTIAEPVRLTGDGIDPYARRGVALTRDAASEVLAALSRDSYELRARGGTANCNAADLQDKLRQSIARALGYSTYCGDCHERVNQCKCEDTDTH